MAASLAEIIAFAPLLVLIGGVTAGLAVVLCVVVPRARACQPPSGAVLILAAHPDDCVIMAGEYAVKARETGRQVFIVYLTCGSDMPGDQRAQARHAEAVHAWGLAGIPAEDVHFLDAPQSVLGGPSALTAAHKAHARLRLREILRGLPAGSAVFVPAAGESHVDHRTLREIALLAILEADRPDLHILEAPEYNSYYSLWHCPARSLLLMGRTLPVFGRLLPASSSLSRAGFIHGGRGCRLPRDATRLALKRDMLRTFASENSELLVRLFGYPDLFRPVHDVGAALRAQNAGRRGYFRVGDRWLGYSVLCLWLAIWGAAFGCVGAASYILANAGGVLLALAGVTVAAGTLLLALKRRQQPEKAGTLASVAAGLALGSIWALVKSPS